MNEAVITVAVNTIVSAVVTTLFGYIVRLLKKNRIEAEEARQDLKKMLDSMKKGVLGVLNNDICVIYDQYKNASEVPGVIKNRMMTLYEAYSELGGDGNATEMNRTIMEKPVAMIHY